MKLTTLLGALCACYLLAICTASKHCDKSGTKCPGGKKYCTCPGDRKQVYHHIICHDTGVWKCSPESDNMYSDCSRYDNYNCKTCRNGNSRTDMNGCSSCHVGFTGGQCQDINECASNNGGCQQHCHNTHGSYYCNCSAGWSLDANKHTCTRKLCGKPPDEDGLIVRSSSYWEFESYAEYSCTRLHHVLSGNPIRQCVVSGSGVAWNGAAPTCVPVCDASEEHAQCGVSGVDPNVCGQLGCCTLDQQTTCHMKPGNIYLSYHGYKPSTQTGVTEHTSSGSNQCRDLCEASENCTSFAIREDQNNFMCYHYIGTREMYINNGEIEADEAAIFYDPLFFEGDIMWTEEKGIFQEILQLGCFNLQITQKFLTVDAVPQDSRMTGMKCVEACRTLGYSFAGVRVDECRCGHDIPVDRMVNSTRCDYRCGSDTSQVCGGDNHYTVATVARDQRHLGCFNETDVYVPVQLREASAVQTVEDCLQKCADYRFGFAGVINGSDCYCGKEYGHALPVQFYFCDTKCQGNLRCGGDGYVNIFSTGAAYDLSSGRVSHLTPTLYHKLENLTALETYKFTVFPELQKLITTRIILSADTPFQTPYEDMFASSGDLYSKCASLKEDFEVTDDNDVITVRAYHVKFSSIAQYLTSSTRQVNIYCQAFVADADIDTNYILIVRTRQLFMDREKSTMVRFSTNKPGIETSTEEWARLVREGPYPDLMFQRMSYLCAQVLINTKDKVNVLAGYAMIRSIASAPALDIEQKAMRNSAAGLLARISGADLSKINFVPFYNKNHLVKQLDTYFTEISIYKEDYDRLNDQMTAYSDFLQYASQMNQIHQDTIVGEASIAVENLEQSYLLDLETQNAIEQRYNEAEIKLEEAQAACEQEMEQIKKTQRRKVFRSFLSGMVKMMTGRYVPDGSMMDSLKELQATMNKLADIVSEIEKMMVKINTIMAGMTDIIYTDNDQVMVDLEAMISMRVAIVEWEALQAGADILMEDIDLKTAPEYRASLAEYCVWGKALTESMVTSAETMRSLLEQKAILDLRLEQQSKSLEVLANASDTVEERKKLLRVMEEQTLDVTVDLNEILVQFCLAFFYENLTPCKENFLPSYQESLSQLLLKINTAKRDGLYIADVTSTVSRTVVLNDDNYVKPTTPPGRPAVKPGNGVTDWKTKPTKATEEPKTNKPDKPDKPGKPVDPISSTTVQVTTDGSTEMVTTTRPLPSLPCEDPHLCPVVYLAHHHILLFSIQPYHPSFADLRKYRVNEIFITLEGLGVPNTADYLKFYLTTSGLFLDQRERIFNFLTRPIHLAFEKKLDDTGHLTIHADFPDEVHRITPFANWVLSISDTRSTNIDIYSITAIHIRFDGTAIILPEV